MKGWLEKEAPQNKLQRFFGLNNLMANLRGDFWNTLWLSLEKLSRQLEEFGIDDCISAKNNFALDVIGFRR